MNHHHQIHQHLSEDLIIIKEANIVRTQDFYMNHAWASLAVLLFIRHSVFSPLVCIVDALSI
jgi:hypothetical protein